VTPAAVGNARAKVNLWLRVLAREESGYHQLETMFCALELADTIAIELAGDDIELDVHGADLGDPRGNLVYRAATAYFASIGARACAHVRLEKRVPHGAGLGGGSSDAATTLRLLDALHGEALGTHRLLRIATAVGADVPFFTTGAAAALAWGRGERLLPITPPPPRPVVVAVPDTAMATAHAYAELARRRVRDRAAPPAAVRHDTGALSDWDALVPLAANDFENIVFERIAGLADARERLLRHGASLALLAGSGSAVFGVFADDAAALAAQQALRDAFPAWRILPTRTAADSLEIGAG
jgi:4-diphosphocytidyl-2-C-methyl-D-erythritol kinase